MHACKQMHLAKRVHGMVLQYELLTVEPGPHNALHAMLLLVVGPAFASDCLA